MNGMCWRAVTPQFPILLLPGICYSCASSSLSSFQLFWLAHRKNPCAIMCDAPDVMGPICESFIFSKCLKTLGVFDCVCAEFSAHAASSALCRQARTV
mmetsp:Transcript_104726/g.202869  ORF Transcript_104726/g.202869 Transcript_104726/m.202869 type:complete len:98 (-) Transcript_104726:25-318(-)